MSEVDRLSNSGLYPALPIADRRSSKDDKDSRQRSDRSPDRPASQAGDTPQDPAAQRLPKSIIDEYA
jgi:hypothetical protein